MVLVAGVLGVGACASETPPAATPATPSTVPSNVTALAASDEGVDPVTLPPLANSSSEGPRSPAPRTAELSPISHLSSTITPTLTIPGVSGPWTFTIDDSAGAESDFGPLVYQEEQPSTRVPENAGLVPGRLYTWTATQDGSLDVLGSFTVDTQLFDVQHMDRVGAVEVGMATGEATLLWNSHAVQAVAGQVGFSLRFAGSNAPQAGLPPGWRLNAATSSPFERLDVHPDDTVTLRGVNGLVVHYRAEGEGRYVPFEQAGGPFSSAGSAPVVAATPDGVWYVAATHDQTTVFQRPTGADTAFPVLAGAPNSPALQSTWSGGRLRSVVDPVSRRSLDFRYGGDACPAPPDGFVAAPTGLLCAVQFWDGSTTALHYTNDPRGDLRLARVVDRPEAGRNGAQVTDVGYDMAGRIAAVRSPLATAAVAAGVIGDDVQFTTQVTYDDLGRVDTVTAPAAAPGALRCQRRYDYLSAVVTAAFDSCFGGVVTQMQFDGATLVPTEITGSDGRSRSFDWDVSTLRPRSKTEADATVSEYRSDRDTSTTTGPTRGPMSQAPVITHRHDDTVQADGTSAPWRGLHMLAWPWSDLLSGYPTTQLGPTLGDVLTSTLTVNWATSPTGVSGPWSAVLTGEIIIDTPGTYRFASNTSNATLRVGNVLCDADRCDALALGAGVHAIRVDVVARDEATSMDVVWSGPDTGGVEQSVPTDRLRPGYGRITSSTVFDPLAPPGTVPATTISEYADPTRSQLTARVNQAGLRTTLDYEADGVGWNRQIASTLPGGNRVQFTYWGDTEVATPPCPGGAAAVQGGARRHVVTPGTAGSEGPTATSWVDAAGRVVARRVGDGAVTCTTYDSAGRVAATEVVSGGTVAREQVRYAVDGDPRITDRIQTLGTEMLTRREVVDLLGRPVRLVDEFGVQLDLVYDDRTGDVAEFVTTPRGGNPLTVTQTFDARGRVSAITVDGTEVATLTRDADTVTRVRFSNAVEVAATYDDLVRLVSMDWTTSDGEQLGYQQQVTLAGLVTSSQYRVGTQRSTARYTHDSAGRLASMSWDAGDATTSRQWTYRYDDNSNRLAVTVDGVTTTSTYDRADRLTRSDDASLTTGIEHDSSGNVVRLGTMALRYDASDHLVEVRDGDVVFSWRRDVHGTVLSTTRQGPDGIATTSNALGGLTLDGDGRPVAQTLELPGGAVLQRSLEREDDIIWSFSTFDGDTFFTTDAAGRRVGDVQRYTPFGEPLDATAPGGWQASHGVVSVPTSTPLNLMGARVYAPTLGRFLQLDPVVGGSANGYDFANQNPVHINDPTGESFLDWLPTVFTLSATVASMALVPPATSFLMGAAMGALVTASMKAGQYLVARAVGHDSPFTFAQAAEQVVLSFAFGGWGGYTGFTKTASVVKFPVANRAWILGMIAHAPPRHTPAPVSMVGSQLTAPSGVGVGGVNTTGVSSVAAPPRLRAGVVSGEWWSPMRRLVLPLGVDQFTR